MADERQNVDAEGRDNMRAGDGENMSASYDVGYRKPPSAHRFQKGRSGNPKGRPKVAKNTVPKGSGSRFRNPACQPDAA